MELETVRLLLRKPRPEDAEEYVALCNTEFVLRYNAMTPKNIEQVRQSFAQPREDVLLLELKETGRIIGEITLDEDSVRWGVASKELSYWLGEAYSRQGYMKEALGAVIAHLFESENQECVAARCFAPNTASLALLKSLGFTQDGYIPRCVKGYGDRIFDDTLHSLFRKDFV